MEKFVEGAGDLSDYNQEIYDEINPEVEEIRDKIDNLKYFELDEEAYDNILDDSYPTYELGRLEFYASNILKSCDTIAYNCGLGEEEDYQKSEMKDEIVEMIDELENNFDTEIIESVVDDLREELNEAW